jgi:hypothetical protein
MTVFVGSVSQKHKSLSNAYILCLPKILTVVWCRVASEIEQE